MNVLDFILFMKALADMEENDPNTPDLDGNGLSNIYDLIMLKKYLLGILKF
ncbi:MAG: hypothetical protein IIX24_05280 [Peptococcaceae bacterium]|nr:hypothetical protein [Peptococcaceae bacterium]